MVKLSKEMNILLRSAYNSARGRAQKRNENFELTLDFVTNLWKTQKGRCALSGLTFHDEYFSSTFVKRPFAPSIDRIDCSKPYAKNNVQLVCIAVNFARGQWGDDVLRRIAYGIVETEYKREQDWFVAKKEELMAAQKLQKSLDGAEAERLKHRIAGLKATLTKGPSRLRSAGRRAAKEKR